MTKDTRSESEIQSAIKAMLISAGFRVKSTSQNLQRGHSGVTKGIPDLLCWHDSRPGVCLCLEVKNAKGQIKPEQKEAAAAGDIFIVRSEKEAANAAVYFTGECEAREFLKRYPG